MDLGTVVGIGLGAFAVVIGIFVGGANPILYVDVGSVFITLIGSFGALFVSAPMARVMNIMQYIGHVFSVKSYEEEKLIQNLVAFSEKARRDGILALEDDLESLEDEFMRKGIQLVVDGTDPEIIQGVLNNELNKIQERHGVGIDLMDNWGKYAPAFGMIGTLLGLIAMLGNIEDQSSIGSGMAQALITTLYGAFFANLFFIPFKSKLEDKDASEALVKEVMIEGILSIQSGDNPRILEEKLLSFLPPDKREAIKQESVAE